MNIRLIVLISILLPLSLFSQNLKKGFKQLQSGKNTEAAIIFNQAKDEPGMRSAAYYGLALLESAKKDLFKAYANIMKADKFIGDMNPKIVDKVSDYYSADKVKSKKKEVDDQLFAQVKDKKEIALVDRFIKECENSEHFLAVLEFKATLEYEIVKEYDTERDYRQFIDRYPEAKEVADAKRRLNEMAWQKAKKENTIAAYSQFIRINKEAPQLDSAKVLLQDLEYNKALVINTDAAFLKFINKYPNSEQAKSLETKREKLAFDKARAFDVLNVYQAFINDFPESVYIPAVVISRDSLAFRQAKSINTANVYRDFVNNYPNASEVPLAMQLLGNMAFSAAELAYMKDLDHIRALRLKSYSVVRIDENDSANVHIERQLTYDSLGHELSYFEQPEDGFQKKLTRVFAAKGNQMIKEQNFVNEKLQRASLFTYFNEGLIRTESVILYFDRGNFPAEYISTYYYDSLRNLVSKSDSAIMDSAIIAQHTYQYDKRGMLIKEQSQFSDSAASEITYRYDTKKHLVEKTTKNAKGKVQEVISYTYDSQGRKISMKKFNAFGVVNYTYDYGNGKIIESEDVEIRSTNEELHLKYQYLFFE